MSRAAAEERTREAVALRLGMAMLDALQLAVESVAPAAPPFPAPESAPADLVFLEIDEVCRRIGLGRTSVEAMVGRVFTPLKQGRTLRISSHEVDAYQRRTLAEAGAELPGETPPPIDIGRSRRRNPAASSAARSDQRVAHRNARASR